MGIWGGHFAAVGGGVRLKSGANEAAENAVFRNLRLLRSERGGLLRTANRGVPRTV